jgi:hypothetical protein
VWFAFAAAFLIGVAVGVAGLFVYIAANTPTLRF